MNIMLVIMILIISYGVLTVDLIYHFIYNTIMIMVYHDIEQYL